MTILFYIVLGLIAGAIAKLILPGKQGGGIIATIVLGVLGALIGGLLGNLIFQGKFSVALEGNFWISLITAVVGSLILLFIYGLVTKNKRAA